MRDKETEREREKADRIKGRRKKFRKIKGQIELLILLYHIINISVVIS